MEKEEIIKAFYNSKTKTEFLNLVGICTTHKSGTTINNEIQKLLSFANIMEDYSSKAFTIRYNERLKQEYLKNPRYCKICNCIIPFEKRNNKYCSQSCATKDTNLKRKHLDTTKKKISKSLKNILQKDFMLISECIKLGILENPFNYEYNDVFINPKRCKEFVCPECGKTYHTYLQKCGKLKNWKQCSKECKINHTNKINLAKIEERIKNGTFKGWQSRNITSYAENFFMNVLENNNISYVKEYSLKREHNQSYFLDFYIEKNNIKIDLEIDGKQHKYKERIESDIERDKYIESNGIKIYRIEWNEINTEYGKHLMKEKIEKFLNFYENV